MKTLYVGNQPDPEDRTKIEVSEEDFDAVCRLITSRKPFRIGVLNHITGQHVLLADEDCGLGCRCALKFMGDMPFLSRLV